MHTRSLALVATLLATALLAPAASSGPVTVTVSFRADGEKATFWGYENAQAACAVTVPQGADGGAVLDAAKAQGCIRDWTYTTYNGARFLQSINGVEGRTLDPLCLTVCGYWEMSVDGESVGYGLDDYHATAGSAFGWTYKNVNAWLGVELP